MRTLLTVFKVLKGNVPQNISETFKFQYNEQHQLRSNNCKLYLQKLKIDFMKKLSSHPGVSKLNSQLSEVVSIHAKLSTTNFKI